MFRMHRLWTCIALIGLLLAGRTAEAATAAAKCEAAKLKVAAKYGQCHLNVKAKEAKTGLTFRADLTKCIATYNKKWARAETKGGAACPTSGDADSINASIVFFAEILEGALGSSRFIENGDGTVTDTRTGLVWEQKIDADNEVNYGNPHDVDNTYTWSASGQPPDGSAFTLFLGQLNNCSSLIGDGPLSGGFAGYCDWRLPTYAELRALLDEDPLQCPAFPCVDPFLLPTAVSEGIFGPRYWSSIATTDPTRAYAVGFDYTDSFGPKTESNYVRAVRSNVLPTAQP